MPFGAAYASAYDLLYHDKDYGAECDLIEALVARYGDGPTRKVLDLGCGTGTHAVRLAKHGYDVVGVDRSSGMIRIAKEKVGRRRLPIRFVRGDVRTVRVREEFDLALIMFAVLGYQLDDADVRATLTTARRHLRPGGLLVFDVWHGPAVLAQRPGERVKMVSGKGGRMFRATSGELDGARPVCTVRYSLWQLNGRRVTTEIRETHRMRYFFVPELNTFLRECGFEPIRFGAFPDFDRNPDDTAWNIVGVARAI